MAETKRGRPPKAGKPRTVAKRLIMTAAEKEMLTETAAMYEMSENATIIRAIFEMHERANVYKPTGKYAKPKQQDEASETVGGE